MPENKAGMLRPAFLVAYLIAITIGGVVWGGGVDEDSQKELYNALATTAGIIFGVVGAWIAIVFPDALKDVMDTSREDEEEKVLLVRRLLFPMMLSTFILAIVLMGMPLGAVFAKSRLYQDNTELWLAASFTLLLILTSLQFGALLYTLVPLGIADATVFHHAAKKQTRRKVTGSSQIRERRAGEE